MCIRDRAEAVDPANWKYPYTVGQTVHAWMPWVILILCCALWGAPAFKTFLNNLFSNATFSTTLLGSKFSGTASLPVWDMPALHNLCLLYTSDAADERS